MRALLVSDLHYDLRKLDWILAEADGVDLLAVAGDVLDIASGVPLDAQIVGRPRVPGPLRRADHHGRVLRQPRPRLAHRGRREDDALDHRGAPRRRARRRRQRGGRRLARHRVRVVGGSGDARVPAGLARRGRGTPATALALGVPRAAGGPAGRGPAPSSSATRSCPRLLDRHQPEVVLCGHIHQAPFVDGGAWYDQVGGPRCCSTAGTSAGNIPAHVFLDLDEGDGVVVVDGGGGRGVLRRVGGRDALSSRATGPSRARSRPARGWPACRAPSRASTGGRRRRGTATRTSPR